MLGYYLLRQSSIFFRFPFELANVFFPFHRPFSDIASLTYILRFIPILVLSYNFIYLFIIIISCLSLYFYNLFFPSFIHHLLTVLLSYFIYSALQCIHILFSYLFSSSKEFMSIFLIYDYTFFTFL